MISPFESLESETKGITLCLEKFLKKSNSNTLKDWLAQRRDLHTDMSRKAIESDAHIARYQLAKKFAQ